MRRTATQAIDERLHSLVLLRDQALEAALTQVDLAQQVQTEIDETLDDRFAVSP